MTAQISQGPSGSTKSIKLRIQVSDRPVDGDHYYQGLRLPDGNPGQSQTTWFEDRRDPHCFCGSTVRKIKVGLKRNLPLPQRGRTALLRSMISALMIRVSDERNVEYLGLALRRLGPGEGMIKDKINGLGVSVLKSSV